MSGTSTAPQAAAPQAAAPQNTDLALLRRLWPFVARHHGLLWANLLLMPLTIVFELAQPFVIKYAVEHHIAVQRVDGLGWLAVVYAALVVGQSVSAYFEQSCVQLLGQRAMHDVRMAVYDHVMRQRLRFFDRMPVGRLMTRMTNDIENINEMFAQGVVTLIADFVKMLVIVGIMLYLDVTLTLLTFVTLPLLWVLVKTARAAMRRSFREIRARLAAMNAFVQEHLSGIRVIQITGRASAAHAEFNTINAAHRDAYLDSIRADAAMYAFVEALAYLAIAVVAWWAARQLGLDQGHAVTAVALVVIFIEYINKFFIPVRDLSAKYAVLQGAMAATERIVAVLDENEPDGQAHGVAGSLAVSAPEPLAAADATAPTSAPAIAFRDVHFGYGAEPILRGISFEVAPGATVAVVGATGSGKSTLIKLLARLYEIDAGAIEFFGAPLHAMPLATLRRQVAVVSQDVMLFSGTLYDNIALGDPIARARVQQALTEVGLAPMLAARQLDLDGIVAERGSNFSTGERQLIAFCRALVRDPRVLVLDEATAHVDPAAEALIERAVRVLMAGRTTLVIAHRLTTIANADTILVVDQGNVVESGRHQELLARGGMYAALERTFRRSEP